MTNTAEIRHRVKPEGRLVPAAAATAKVSMPSGSTNSTKPNNVVFTGRATFHPVSSMSV
jgi:hypothetical protein